MITPLDQRRRTLAIITLVIFVLVFVPAPLTEHIAENVPVSPRNSAYILPMAVPLVGVLLSRLRR
jgi:hypothetical protein